MLIIRPAAEVLVLLDVVRLEPDAEEVVPQLALVTLHPVHLCHTQISSSDHLFFGPRVQPKY